MRVCERIKQTRYWYQLCFFKSTFSGIYLFISSWRFHRWSSTIFLMSGRDISEESSNIALSFGKLHFFRWPTFPSREQAFSWSKSTKLLKMWLAVNYYNFLKPSGDPQKKLRNPHLGRDLGFGNHWSRVCEIYHNEIRLSPFLRLWVYTNKFYASGALWIFASLSIKFSSCLSWFSFVISNVL